MSRDECVAAKPWLTRAEVAALVEKALAPLREALRRV